MIRSIGILGRFGYSLLYLPSITFSYLYLTVDNDFLTVLPEDISVIEYSLPIPSLLVPHNELPIYAAIALIGGMWLHHFGIVVYGHDGPSRQPKNRAVVRTVMFGLAYNVPVSDLRQTRSRISLVIQGLPKYNRTSIVTFLAFLPAALFKPLFVISTLMLAMITPLRSLDVTGGALLLVQSSVLIKPYLGKFFPTYVPEDAVDRVQQAEYQISEEKHSELKSDEEQ